MIKKSVSLILLAYLVLISAALRIGGNLILENLISLLPFLILVNLIIFTIFLSKINTIKNFILPILILFIVTLSLSLKLYNFSFLPITSAGSGKTELKIAFLNKLYSNNNFKPINQAIEEINPDILGFSEIKITDPENIKALDNYPCHLSIDSRDDATIAFYSKYSCRENNSGPKIPFVLSAVTEFSNEDYFIFVVHPYPPASNSWIKERDDSLTKLAAYINSLPSDKVILLGDFNLSPWSPSFKKFSTQLVNLKNSAQGQGLKFSWHGAGIQTQIDHIFVPNQANITLFQTEKIAGSDHNLILTQIKIE